MTHLSSQIFWFQAIAFSADLNYVLAASQADVFLFELRTERLVQTFRGHTMPVISMHLSADSTRLLTFSRDQTLRVWEVESGTSQRQLWFNFFGFPIAALIFPDETRFAILSSEWNLRKWNFAERIRLFELF